VAGTKNSLLATVLSPHFIKFVMVGLSGVVVNEAILYAFLKFSQNPSYVLGANAVAIEVSIVTNFLLNDYWTFKDRRTGRMSARLVKFNALMMVGLAVNLAIFYAGELYFGVSAALLANLLGIAVAFGVRYGLSVRYAWMKFDTKAEQASPASLVAV
jgi:dolichol-phosphate mannosyltransferase